MKRPGPEILDTTLWPSTDFGVLDSRARQQFQNRAAAIELYSCGLPIGEVEERSGVDRRTLYRMIERALRRHPDGRPWGFRGLIPSLRTVAYERRKKSHGKGRGLSGSFAQLLDRYRELEGLLRGLIQNREVLLMQRGDRFYVKGLNIAHNRFTGLCRSLGLTAKDYPLNQEEQGRRSLGNTLRNRMLEGFSAATRSAGTERVKPAAALRWGRAKVVTDPFDTVEFDAHKLDLRLKVLDQDPYGDEQAFEIERVWLLALIDIGTRAIIGYTSACVASTVAMMSYELWRGRWRPHSGRQSRYQSCNQLRTEDLSLRSSQRPPMRAGGKSVLTTRALIWRPTAWMSPVNCLDARSMWAPPMSPTIAPSSSDSLAPSRRALPIGCRARPARKRAMSCAS